jgi:hypothetical protein
MNGDGNSEQRLDDEFGAVPLGHIARELPPWRTESVTECGRAAKDVARTLTRDEAAALVKRLGRQRSAMQLCMTCVSASDRNRSWRVSPSAVIRRDVESYGWRGHGARNLLDGELEAIAALIDAHRSEFNGYLAGLGETADLAARRAAKRRPR